MLKFVFTLFNLQGTDALPALAVSFWIISRSKPFVKNFFQVFSNFFDRILFLAAPAGNSVSLAQALPFVKNFLQILSNFFICAAASGRLHRKLAYITIPDVLCQAKKQKISVDFSNPPDGDSCHGISGFSGVFSPIPCLPETG